VALEGRRVARGRLVGARPRRVRFRPPDGARSANAQVTAIAGGVSATDLTSVILAFAAFVVSIASLWFTALRRPKVEVDLMSDGELRTGGTDRALPTGPHVSLNVFLANTGASGTVLTVVDALDYREDNAGLPLWAGVAYVDVAMPRPRAFERDSGVSTSLAVHLAPNTAVPLDGAEDFARRLRTLRSLTFTLGWQWRRSKFPNVRHRETATSSEVVTVSGDRFRLDIIAEWRASETTVDLAHIAEWRDPDAA
jgi:hypothetical protein